MTAQVHRETIEAPAEDVWGFIVDPAALSVWFGADAWLDPWHGGLVLFRFADGSERRGQVEEIAEGRLVRWRWREHRGVGFRLQLGETSTVRIELESIDEATEVRITETPIADGMLAEAG
jgi:uncharacterized protein YndB with AHSA1/START domain